MELRPEHIATKKKIGTLDGKPVVEIVTTGGLHLLVCAKSGVIETLSTGPHRAVSRHIALKRYPDLKITEMAKGDWVDPACFEHLLPRYEALTDRFRDLAE